MRMSGARWVPGRIDTLRQPLLGLVGRLRSIAAGAVARPAILEIENRVPSHGTFQAIATPMRRVSGTRHLAGATLLARRNAAHPRRLRARIDSHIIGAPLLMAPTTAPAYGDHSYVLPVHLDDRLNTVPEPRLNRVCA